jgi:hypothetical protein
LFAFVRTFEVISAFNTGLGLSAGVCLISAGVGLISFRGGEEAFVTVRVFTVFEDVGSQEVADVGVLYVNNDEVAYGGTGDKGVDTAIR